MNLGVLVIHVVLVIAIWLMGRKKEESWIDVDKVRIEFDNIGDDRGFLRKGEGEGWPYE